MTEQTERIMLIGIPPNTDISRLRHDAEEAPRSADRLHALGKALAWQGDAKEALERLRAATALASNIHETHNNLGSVATDLGLYNEAIRAYRRALKLAPNTGWYLQNLAECLSRRHWQMVARGIYCQAVTVDPQGVMRWQDAWRHHPEAVASHPTPVENPVFITGHHHSGTTIMTRLIAAHPRIRNCRCGETRFGTRPATEIRAQLDAWDESCEQSPESRWVEKSVQHSFMIGKLLAFRPHARVIVMMRDGRDVICSTKTRKGEYRYFGQRAEQWVAYNRATMPFWEHPNVKLIKYDELIDDPRGTLMAICEFLEEDYSDAMLGYAETPIQWNSSVGIERPAIFEDRKEHDQLRNWQINLPLFDGRGRWRKEMTEEEKRIVKDVAQDHLERFGFAADANW